MHHEVNVALLFTVPVKKAYYGEGEGAILLDDLLCSGDETTLLDCPTISGLSPFSGNCDHAEDAGVRCNGKIGLQELSWAMISLLFVI